MPSDVDGMRGGMHASQRRATLPRRRWSRPAEPDAEVRVHVAQREGDAESRPAVAAVFLDVDGRGWWHQGSSVRRAAGEYLVLLARPSVRAADE